MILQRTAPRTALLFIVALTALASLAPAASARARSDDSTGFSVAPLRFDIERNEGDKSTYVQQITIRNTNPRATTFRISKEDFEGDQSDPNATPRLLGGEFDSEISGYDWISDYPSSLTIPAGDSRTIKAKVVIPSSASGGHYTALVIAGDAVDIGNANVQSRVAVLFMMDAGGTPPPEIVINEIVTEHQGGDQTVTITTTAEGDTHDTPKAQVIYTDPVTGKVIRREQGKCTTILPGSTGTCSFETTPEEAAHLPGATTGAKSAFSLVGGDGKRVRSALPTEWAGTWSSLLLPLVGLGLFVLYFVFLRRRRREHDVVADYVA